MKILVALTQDLLIGTNLALLQFVWMLVNGALLPQRGVLFNALKPNELSDQVIRRTWMTFRGGVWQTAVLLQLWRAQSGCPLSKNQGQYLGCEPLRLVLASIVNLCVAGVIVRLFRLAETKDFFQNP
jgi:hypothetical protein